MSYITAALTFSHIMGTVYVCYDMWVEMSDWRWLSQDRKSVERVPTRRKVSICAIVACVWPLVVGAAAVLRVYQAATGRDFVEQDACEGECDDCRGQVP